MTKEELQSQAQPNQGAEPADPAMVQGQPQGQAQAQPQGMPMNQGGQMPQQGATTMPQGMPGAMPPQQPSLEDQNGQGTPLIDEVTGSGIDPNTNEPFNDKPEINSMQSARDAFAQAFNTNPNPNGQMPQQGNQQMPPQPPQANSMPPQMPPQMGMQTPGTPMPGMQTQGMPPQMNQQQNMPDVNMIRQMAETAVNQAVASGKLPDLSANDMMADTNYGMPNMEYNPGQVNPMDGVNGMVDETPEGMGLDTIVNNGIPDINSDEFFESFTDNPGQAIMDIANAIAAQQVGELTQQIQPLIDESNKVQFKNRVQDAIRSFSENGHGDFSQYRQGMVDYLNGTDLPMDDPVSYERAYDKAKISALEKMNQELTQTQGRTLADYMSDDSSIDQISQNEKVRGRVINDYLTRLSNGETPQVITESAGNSPDATDPKKANSIKEAGKMFFQRMKEG